MSMWIACRNHVQPRLAVDTRLPDPPEAPYGKLPVGHAEQLHGRRPRSELPIPLADRDKSLTPPLPSNRRHPQQIPNTHARSSLRGSSVDPLLEAVDRHGEDRHADRHHRQDLVPEELEPDPLDQYAADDHD